MKKCNVDVSGLWIRDISYKTIHHNLNANKKMANILKKIQNIQDDKTFLFYHLILLAKI